eukprot:6600955-Pyramimonas_sp.AAC.1
MKADIAAGKFLEHAEVHGNFYGTSVAAVEAVAAQVRASRRRGERIYPQPAPIAEGGREYTRSRHQSRKGRENIPAAGTNRRRGERTYPQPAPNAEGEREYTRSRNQSRRGRE